MAAGLLLLLAVALVVAGCGGGKPDSTPTRSATPTPFPVPTPTTPVPSPTPTAGPTTPPATPAPEVCEGLPYAGVKGPPPSYGARVLRRYPADRAVCDAYWLQQSDDDFVGQSLAVDGPIAYVGGYRWAPTYAKRPCQIAVIDTRTGQQIAFQARFQASVYRPAPTYCRHGGGMDLAADGLWVQETERLWLLDPTRLGGNAQAPVKRVWRMQKGLRGSSMAVVGDRLGVASFRVGGPGRIIWFQITDLLKPGVDDLVLSGGGATDARPVARGRVPRLLQGITPTDAGLFYSSSGTGCAQLIGPDKKVHGFVPGAEDVQFVDRSVYVVSESGARPYSRGKRSTVPVLLRLDRDKVLAAGRDCTAR